MPNRGQIAHTRCGLYVLTTNNGVLEPSIIRERFGSRNTEIQMPATPSPYPHMQLRPPERHPSFFLNETTDNIIDMVTMRNVQYKC